MKRQGIVPDPGIDTKPDWSVRTMFDIDALDQSLAGEHLGIAACDAALGQLAMLAIRNTLDPFQAAIEQAEDKLRRERVLDAGEAGRRAVVGRQPRRKYSGSCHVPTPIT
jgi:hypothetical protein